MIDDLKWPQGPDWDNPNLIPFQAGELLYRNADLGMVADHCCGSLCYLATPYSRVAVYDDGEWSPCESLQCSDRAARWARHFALDGVTAISPIIQSVGMLHCDLGGDLDALDAAFWENWCRPLLVATGPVIIPPIPGWNHSVGIWREAIYALEHNRSVFVIDPNAVPDLGWWGVVV
ncbi:MAG: DUF1937 family protein [Planktomarina sp.]